MRALITGGAGFIGSHLSEALLARDHDVWILDDLSTGALENVEHLRHHPGFHTVIGSVLDAPLTCDLVDRCDVVFHLAAAVGVKLIVEAPVHTIRTNVGGTEAVLEAAAQDGKLVLVASTSEVYGKTARVPFREDDDLLLGPTSKHRWAYACSKMLDEFLALAYGKERGLPVVVARLFNTVGPRQTGRYGMVVPRFVRQALDGEPITIYGDGTQTRSFTWVGDVVSALLSLAFEPRAVGQVFNVGNGVETSIADLAARVRRLAGSSSPIVTIPYDEAYEAGFEDMPRRAPDITKLFELTGYQPSIQLDEILARLIQFERARPSVPAMTRRLAAAAAAG